MNILCTWFRKCLSSVPQSLLRKLITLRSKFTTVPGWNIWRAGAAKHTSPLLDLLMSLIELQTGWDEMHLETSEEVVSPSFSYPSIFSLTLSISWVEFIIYWEGAADDKNSGGKTGAATSLRMNERPHCDPTRGGKHMFCWSWQPGYLQRGLGIPSAGGMEKVEKEEEGSMCLGHTDVKSQRVLAHCPLVRRNWYCDIKGWISLSWKLWDEFGWRGIRGRSAIERIFFHYIICIGIVNYLGGNNTWQH